MYTDYFPMEFFFYGIGLIPRTTPNFFQHLFFRKLKVVFFCENIRAIYVIDQEAVDSSEKGGLRPGEPLQKFI